jgi:hypothetical protein
MREDERKTTSEIDCRRLIAANADRGHGGDAHVRNLIRRFDEVAVCLRISSRTRERIGLARPTDSSVTLSRFASFGLRFVPKGSFWGGAPS